MKIIWNDIDNRGPVENAGVLIEEPEDFIDEPGEWEKLELELQELQAEAEKWEPEDDE